MRKRRADEIYGQGLIISIGIGLISALLMYDIFSMSLMNLNLLDENKKSERRPDGNEVRISYLWHVRPKKIPGSKR